jgi:hypothetical protein
VALPNAAGEALHVFPIRAAAQWRLADHKGNTGHKLFLAPNPPEGALVTYWLGASPGEKDEVKITVTDASGAVVREIKGPKPSLGINRANWDLRREPPVKPEEGAARSFLGPPRGPLVLPGTYTVKVAAAGKEQTRSVVVEEDPRLTAGDAERREWYEAQLRAGRAWTKADAADKAIKSIRKQLEELKAAMEKKAGTPEAVTRGIKDLLDKTAPLASRLSLETPTGFAGAPLASDPDPLLPRARSLGFGLAAFEGAPTAQQKRVIEQTERDLDEAAAAIKSVQQTDVPALNKLIYESGIGKLDPGPTIP